MRVIAEIFEIELRFLEDQLDLFVGEIVDGNDVAGGGRL
jgi:hypothetical protein